MLAFGYNIVWFESILSAAFSGVGDVDLKAVSKAPKRTPSVFLVHNGNAANRSLVLNMEDGEEMTIAIPPGGLPCPLVIKGALSIDETSGSDLTVTVGWESFAQRNG